jgi:hypothetical protein
MKKILFALTLVLCLSQTQNAVATTKDKNLKTKENIKACSNFKSKYSVSVLESWSSGQASDEQLLKEINLNINNLSKYNKKTTKSLKLSINKILESENIAKKAIKDENLEDFLTSLSLKIGFLQQTQKICDLIK